MDLSGMRTRTAKINAKALSVKSKKWLVKQMMTEQNNPRALEEKFGL